MATKTQFSVFPDWGNYAQANIGAYYLLDKANELALNFPVSVKIGTVRQNGKWGNNDDYYYAQSYCPSGNYWKVVYPFEKFGYGDGEVILEYGVYDSGSLFVKSTVNNRSDANVDIEISVFGSAHADMVSYSGGLVQNHVDSANYVGMNWETQSTKFALISSADTITKQDIQDADYATALDSSSDPYSGDGLGRWCRAKLAFTANAGVTGTTKVFVVSVAVDQSTAASQLATVLAGYSTKLIDLKRQYKAKKSKLFNDIQYGDLIERNIALILFNIAYTNLDSGAVWKLVTLPSRGYITYWYSWDSAFSALSLAEAGYTGIALDSANYPFDKSGNYVGGMPMPWVYVIWRLYELTGKTSVLSDYYAGVKAYYNASKSGQDFGTYYRFTSGYNSGLDNHPLWTASLDSQTSSSDGGVSNYTVDPMILTWFLHSAYYLKSMAVVLDNGESGTWDTEMSNFTTLLNNLWDDTDKYYYSLIPLDEGKIQNETFDSDIVGQAPSWWSNYGDSMTRVVAGSGHSGNCLRIYSASAVDGGVSQSAFTLENSTQYVVTFWYKADANVVNGHVILQNQDGYSELASKHIEAEKTTFTKASFTFTTPSSNVGGYKLLVGLGSYGDKSAGEFIVDDIKIEKAYASVSKRKTIASLFPILYPGLDSTKAEYIRETFYDYSLDGGVATSKPGEVYSYNTYWDGPAWIVTNYLIAKGMRSHGFVTEAKIIEASIDSWDGDYSSPFKEIKKVGESPSGVKQFSSFQLFTLFLKEIGPKRKSV